MVLAVAFDDVKKNGIKHQDGEGQKGGYLSTRFFGAHDKPDLPFATFTRQDPGRYSRTHFHIVDQFQVIEDGKCKLGRHELSPYSVHFSRAYTPYGPLVADAEIGFRFFVMRAHPDPGSQGVRENREKLMGVANRHPWQISRPVAFPALESGGAIAGAMLHAVPDIKDENGLAAYTLSMKPDAAFTAPDPAHGDGQYLVVLKGSVLHDDRELRAPALVFVYPEDGPFQVRAGSAGVEALVLNFPRRQTQTASTVRGAQANTRFKTWQCALCAFAYDEAAGLPEEGIAPGTRWEHVPETWSCPDCSASKSDFQMVEVQNQR